MHAQTHLQAAASTVAVGLLIPLLFLLIGGEGVLEGLQEPTKSRAARARNGRSAMISLMMFGLFAFGINLPGPLHGLLNVFDLTLAVIGLVGFCAYFVRWRRLTTNRARTTNNPRDELHGTRDKA